MNEYYRLASSKLKMVKGYHEMKNRFELFLYQSTGGKNLKQFSWKTNKQQQQQQKKNKKTTNKKPTNQPNKNSPVFINKNSDFLP